MSFRPRSGIVLSLMAILGVGFLSGCGGGEDSGSQSLPPADSAKTNSNVVVAFGDSITYGNTPSYPQILASLINKTVINAGVNGSLASENIGRARNLTEKYHPDFMLILYGLNDVLHGSQTTSAVAALAQMLSICADAHVTPVLATYPEPILGYAMFSPPVRLLNQGIRDLAAARGIQYVDLEIEFAADRNLYEDDGLHPNDEGSALIALSFADLF